MKADFKKVKTEHTILPEFHYFLKQIENIETIQRIIPWRINRQQKSSSALRFTISYPTTTGLKAKMSKGSTSQELFIICKQATELQTQTEIQNLRNTFTSTL